MRKSHQHPNKNTKRCRRDGETFAQPNGRLDEFFWPIHDDSYF